MRKLGFILAWALAFGSGVVGCRQDPATTEQPDRIERTNTPISLGVGTLQAPNSGALGTASRATGNMGKVIEDPALLANEDLALYGVRQAFGSGDLSWDDRMISTTAARLEPNGSDYRFNYGTTPAYYPEGGYLNVYALYPVDGTYVQLTDDNVTAPSAQITLGTTFATQYDVLYGKTEQLTVAQAQQAKVTLDHALAQLRIKVYRDPEVSDHPTLTKVVVRGVRKATLADMTSPTLTPSTDPADVVEFVAFEGSLALTATDKNTAHGLNTNTPLMLVPGLATIDRITVTVDGNTFETFVPSDWELKQGKVNTATVLIKKFEVRLESPWTVTPWGVGQGANEGIENNGKIIRISAKMLTTSGSTKTAYAGTPPATADVTLSGSGYTNRGIPVTVGADGVFTTEPFNCGILNDNPIYIEGLTLYNAAGAVLFSGRLANGRLHSGATLYIDEANNGLLRYDHTAGQTADLSMTFGGFGEGTVAVPYEVSLPVHLARVAQLLGSSSSRSLNGTSTGGAHFVQVDHIDLSGGPFSPIGSTTTSAAFYGSYNGGGKEVRNLSINWTGGQHVGLFGWVAKASGAAYSGEVSNVVLASGSVVSTSTATSGCYVGSVVGNLGTGAKISRCASRVVVSAKATVGGVVGYAANTTSITECAYLGSVSSDNTGTTYLGGVVGNTTGTITLTDCYNRGSVRYTGSNVSAYVGGLAGYFTAASTAANCYNQGRVESTPIGAANPPERTGALFGQVSTTSTLPAATGNLFAWETAYQQPVGTPKLIGTDPSGALTAKAAGKTDAELKNLAPTLGGAWKNDNPQAPLNGGYPMLKWQ